MKATKATIGVEVSGKLMQFELNGKIGYEPLSAIMSAPTNSGGGMRMLDVLKIWEGDTTYLVPLGHLAFLKLESNRGE